MNKRSLEQSLHNESVPKRKIPEKYCGFCKVGVHYIDYKNAKFLKRFLNPQAKILARRYTGTCRKHQNRLKSAVKRAQCLAVLPFLVDNFK